MSDFWPALWLSLRIASAATVATLLVGVPLAWAMARRRRFAGKTLIDALILMPLVLPPTVVGYVILMLFGAQGAVGHWLMRQFHYSIVFRFEGAALAAAVVALPMVYIPAKAAFGSIERELEEIARLFGANRLQVFWHVSLPLARRGLASGAILAFARATGEFGATIMVFGWSQDRVTLPISVYADYTNSQLSHATAAVVALSLVSLGLMLAYNATWGGRGE